MTMKIKVFWSKWDSFRGNPAACALGVEDLLVLDRPKPRRGIRKNVDMCADPFGNPHELELDLTSCHEPSHLKSQFVPCSTIREQKERDAVVCLPEDLLVLPRAAPDVTRDHMTQSLEVTNVEVDELLRGRSTPVFVSVEVEAGQARKPVRPSRARGVHGEDHVIVVFEE